MQPQFAKCEFANCTAFGHGKATHTNCQVCYIRDRPRFFDQVGHQTTDASIGNKHFFNKY